MPEPFEIYADNISQFTHNCPELRDGDAISTDTSSTWIPSDFDWGGDWELMHGLMVNFQTTPDGVIAVPQLEGLNEYGEGNTLGAALLDLLHSFTDYRESLEEREDKLHPTSVAELAVLRKLVQRKATIS